MKTTRDMPRQCRGSRTHHERSSRLTFIIFVDSEKKTSSTFRFGRVKQLCLWVEFVSSYKGKVYVCEEDQTFSAKRNETKVVQEMGLSSDQEIEGSKTEG